MENKRSDERQFVNIHEKGSCGDCESFIREDENLKSKDEFKGWLKETFKEEFGDYKSNSERIRVLERKVYFLTGYVVGTLFAFVYIFSQLSKLMR